MHDLFLEFSLDQTGTYTQTHIHLISHEAWGCIVCWLCVCVRVYLSRTTFHEGLHLWCTNPCEDLGVDGITFGPAQNESQHTHWIYLPKSSHRWLPDIAAWCIVIKKNNLNTGAIQITFGHMHTQCQTSCKKVQKEQTGDHTASHVHASPKTNTSPSSIVDISWRAHSNGTHAAWFCNGNEVHLCVMTPVARGNSMPAFAQIAGSSFTSQVWGIKGTDVFVCG